MIDKKIKELLLDIYRLDKTPRYGYSSSKKNLDNCGRKAGTGMRWLTPKEIILGEFRDNKIDLHEEMKVFLTPKDKE